MPVQVRCLILDAWGWCTGMTQREGMGREEGGGFRMGTQVYLWWIHFDNIVKFKNKIKLKKNKNKQKKSMIKKKILKVGRGGNLAYSGNTIAMSRFLKKPQSRR